MAIRQSGTTKHRQLTLITRLAVVAVVLIVGAAGVWLLTRAATPKPSLTTADIPALQVTAADIQPGTAIPVRLTAADPKNATSTPTSLDAWAGRITAATGIPVPALRAYGNAELAMRTTEPGCHLTWATLAGIGRVESDHGQFGGAHLLANGEESRPVIGVPLDGTGGVRNMPDTDQGRYDGDPVHDHAVGPMQFLPSTWLSYGADAMGTGHPDPENVNDAALAAANYLCVGGRDMGTATGWWSGLLSYNDSNEYGQKVFGLADSYARKAFAVLNKD
ncbi:MAG TPA: lytic murein transglycosylase [Pseudonocardiaceae bacterium]|nr:lytic murein transglycosylase [Pseudonocardiaceae bacterium]